LDGFVNGPVQELSGQFFPAARTPSFHNLQLLGIDTFLKNRDRDVIAAHNY
jgi:hypothetical protein